MPFSPFSTAWKGSPKAQILRNYNLPTSLSLPVNEVGKLRSFQWTLSFFSIGLCNNLSSRRKSCRFGAAMNFQLVSGQCESWEAWSEMRGWCGLCKTKPESLTLFFLSPNLEFRLVPVSEMDTFCSLPTILTQGMLSKSCRDCEVVEI